MRAAADDRRPCLRVLAVVAAAAMLYGAFVVLRLEAFGWDVSAFVVAGDGVTDRAHAPAGLGLNLGTDGYDGQAYYRLARDPLTDVVTEHGIAFARPAYWQTRIGYPVTVWVGSLGGVSGLVPLTMLVVNLVAMLAMAGGAGLLALGLGHSPWWGLVPTLWAGYVVGLGEDLTEPLAGALLVATLLALQRRHPALATVALTAAALTRETSLVLAVAIVVAWLWHRSRHRDAEPAWWVGIIPLVAYAGWRTWVRARWAEIVPNPPSDSPFTAPLVALGRYLGRALGDLGGAAGNLALLGPTLAVLLVLATALRPDRSPHAGSPDGDLHLRLALAGYLALLICLPVWDRGQAYLRWCCEPVLLGWLLLLRRRDHAPALAGLAVLVAIAWLASVAATYSYPATDGWRSADERTDGR